MKLAHSSVLYSSVFTISGLLLLTLEPGLLGLQSPEAGGLMSDLRDALRLRPAELGMRGISSDLRC